MLNVQRRCLCVFYHQVLELEYLRQDRFAVILVCVSPLALLEFA
jgi:hypothetical protein